MWITTCIRWLKVIKSLHDSWMILTKISFPCGWFGTTWEWCCKDLEVPSSLVQSKSRFDMTNLGVKFIYVNKGFFMTRHHFKAKILKQFDTHQVVTLPTLPCDKLLMKTHSNLWNKSNYVCINYQEIHLRLSNKTSDIAFLVLVYLVDL